MWTPDVLGDEGIREDAAPVRATLEAYQRRLEAWSRGRVDEASLQHARPTLVQQAPSTKRRYQIGTYDHIRGAWEPCLFAAVFFSFLVVPLRSVLYCTDWRSRAFDPTLVIEYALDVVFLMDMYLRLYHMEAPEVYKNSVRFKVDMVANVPYVILAPLLNHPQRYAMLRYPHLLRGFNLKAYLVHIRDYLEVKHHILIRDKTITIFQRTYETVFLILMACFWAIIKSRKRRQDLRQLPSGPCIRVGHVDGRLWGCGPDGVGAGSPSSPAPPARRASRASWPTSRPSCTAWTSPRTTSRTSAAC